MLWLSVALFVLLSPGLLLTIPPGKGGVWMSGKTSVASVLVHAVIFAVASYYLSQYYNSFVSGFQTSTAVQPLPNSGGRAGEFTKGTPFWGTTPITKYKGGNLVTDADFKRYNAMASPQAGFAALSDPTKGCLPDGTAVPRYYINKYPGDVPAGSLQIDGKSDPFRCCSGVIGAGASDRRMCGKWNPARGW
jgi:hypothetical protein